MASMSYLPKNVLIIFSVGDDDEIEQHRGGHIYKYANNKLARISEKPMLKLCYAWSDSRYYYLAFAFEIYRCAKSANKKLELYKKGWCFLGIEENTAAFAVLAPRSLEKIDIPSFKINKST